MPAGFNPAAFGSYNNLGTIHYPGTPILVSSGQAYTGAFSVNDMLTCQGALSVVSGGSINLNSGVLISGTGNANLGNGAYFVENAASGIQGGSLTASYGYVGYSGTGTFNQVAGTNTDSGSFFNGGVFLGYNAGANGTYNLSGTATLSTYTEAVGYNGVGTFNQSGGANSTSFFSPLYIGYNTGSRGVYNLSGTGSLSGGEYVGNSGSGTLNQSGGTNNPGTIYIGYNAGSIGVYNLSGPGLLTGTLYVGNSGNGSFTQTGGTNNAGTIYLGAGAGGNGTYTLSAPGLLTASAENIGYSSSGQFLQTSGTNNVGSLYLGNNSGGIGSYLLSASGLLTASAAEYVGISGSGTFTQSGGSNSAVLLSIGSLGRYKFSGGTLQVGGLSNQGVFDGTGSSGLLAVSGSAFIDFSQAALVNVGSMSVNIGPNALLLLPAGFDPATAFHSYSNLGLTHVAGTVLNVSPSQGFAGFGTLNDFVNCQGTITAANGSINLNGGIAVSGSGNVNLGGAGVSINDTTGRISGGSLQASAEYVGKAAFGNFTQSGGYNRVNGTLSLGYSSGASGTYNLSGQGILSTLAESIGGAGTGALIQTGGSNSSGFISIGSLGRYQFSGGTLQLTGAGLTSQGIFDATGSTGLLNVTGSATVDLSRATLVNTGSMSMNLGSNSLLLLPAGIDPATAFASLNNQGTTHVGGTVLTILPGQRFSGTFTLADVVNCQGALVASSGPIVLNNGLVISGTGTVNLGQGQLNVNNVTSGISGGSMTAATQSIGNSSAGAFAQLGGTNTVGTGGLALGYNVGVSGTYSLSGPAVLSTAIEYVGFSGNGSFVQSGGVNVGSGNSSNQLYLAMNPGSSGSYNVSAGSLNFVQEYIGNSGAGTFTQSGGSNFVGTPGNGSSSMGNLYLAYNPGSSGTYNLSGSGLLSANTELIGYSGPATFNQSGGTNSILGNGLSLIAAANYTSVYNLSGSGVLTSTSEIVGQYGILNQSGGSNSTTTLTINANNGLSVGGSYVLSGVASLTASNGEYVSQTSPGLFTQIGGLNSTGFVNIGTQGNLSIQRRNSPGYECRIYKSRHF